MEELFNILNTYKPEIDWKIDKNLVSDGLLDSIDIINIIMKLEENYAIEISLDYLDAENFEDMLSIKKIIDGLIAVNN